MYNTSPMPATSNKVKVNEDGVEKDGLSFTFTNGAKEQLEELKAFFKVDTELDVLKTGISILANFKKEKEKEKDASKK